MNRRQSDLVDKSDGVLYTSDGRDVEMSVASTKAFYSQIAAGFLLALALADEFGADDAIAAPRDRHERLAALARPARRDARGRRTGARRSPPPRSGTHRSAARGRSSATA